MPARAIPGPESVGVQIYAVEPSAGKWDRATWDGAAWGALIWSDVDCQITEAASRWGATDEAGILSQATAGEVDLTTFDPDRILDPLNQGSPFYGAIRPGTPVRIVGLVGAVGVVTNASFEAAPPLVGWTPTAPALASQSPLDPATDPAPDGAYTLRLAGDGLTAGPSVSQVVAVAAGRRITIGVQARCSAGVEARMRVDGLDSTGATIASGLLLVTTTSPAFVPLGGTFSVPNEVTQVRVHLYLLGTPAAGLAARFDAVTWTAAPMIASTAIIDEVTHDVATARGRVRAVDGIAYLAQAQVPDAAVLPNTMRARARSVVAAVGLTAMVPVEPEAPSDPDVDPPVAAHDGKAAAAWEIISRAAEDSLTYVWIDPTGTLRFRSWGALPDGGLSLGCPDAESADELWLAGVSTVLATASAQPIRNQVRAYSAGTTWQPTRADGVSVGKYGPRPYEVTRVVPDFAAWADRILADRADAGLEIGIGEVRPWDQAELAALLALDQIGPSTIRVRDDEHGDLIDLDCGVIGAKLAVTAAGWRWRMVTTIPRVEWENVTPEPPIPPIPPANPWHVETRTYNATGDALLALTSGGAKYGAGASTSLPVGGWSGWTYRAAVKFPSIPWTKIRAIRSATLNLRTTNQIRVGFGSSPKLEVRRATSSWSEGSASSPSSGNAVVWPGPSTTTSGAKTSGMPGGEGVEKDIDITAIVRAWAPSSVGGSGASQYGIVLREISGSTTYTTEVYPREQSAAAGPSIVLVVEVFD